MSQEQEDKAFVKARHPDAKVTRNMAGDEAQMLYRIVRSIDAGRRVEPLSAWYITEAAAWATAARNIRQRETP